MGVTCVAISQDGSFVASGSYDETLKIWDMATLTQIMQNTETAFPWNQ